LNPVKAKVKRSELTREISGIYHVLFVFAVFIAVVILGMFLFKISRDAFYLSQETRRMEMEIKKLEKDLESLNNEYLTLISRFNVVISPDERR